MDKADVVALIQARGGSKGVPDKNIRPLGSFPLLAWSIAACRMAKTIERTVLSTDSEEIADVGRRYGAEVPFMRPAEFATDEATDFVVIRHALEWFRDHEGHVPELVVQIRPTTPLREPAVMDEAVKRIKADPKATALRSVFEMPEPHCKMFGMKEDGFLHGLCPDDPRPEYFNLPRQSFPPTYNAQGYVDIIRASTVLEQGMCYGERILGFVTPDSGEVDREEDFRRLEFNMLEYGAVVYRHLCANFPKEKGHTNKSAPTARILTKKDCLEICRRIGMAPGMSVMVHASLSGFGYLVNGPYDLIDAMLEAVGPEGTLLAPTHTGQLTDPGDWHNPSVPDEWLETIRREMKPFDATKTPVRGRGILPEYFLRYDDVRRSNHPLNSTAALGAKAEHFTCSHPLHEPEGISSPCHKLYQEGGYVLLLGIGLSACTALHTAEYLADCPYLGKSTVRVGVADENGETQFVRIEKYPGSSEGFEKLRGELADTGHLSELMLDDDYQITFFPLAPAIDLALAKLKDNLFYFRDDS